MTDDEVPGMAHELRRFAPSGAMAPAAPVDHAAFGQALPGHRFECRAGPGT